MKIQEALNAQDRSSVWLKGKVVRAFDVATGEKDGRPWRRLDFEMQDDSGTIRVAWWDPSVGSRREIEGRMVTLEPIKEDGRNKGCYVQKDDRSGKMKVVARGASVQLVEGGQPAAAGGGGGSNGQNPAAYAGTPTLTLSRYVDVLERLQKKFFGEWGFTDQQAVAALVNTTAIALTQGRLVLDEVPVDEGFPQDD